MTIESLLWIVGAVFVLASYLAIEYWVGKVVFYRLGYFSVKLFTVGLYPKVQSTQGKVEVQRSQLELFGILMLILIILVPGFVISEWI